MMSVFQVHWASSIQFLGNIHCCLKRYSCALLNDYLMTNPLHNDVFAITNDVLMGFFRFVTISSLLREPILRITMIKTTDRRVFKMAAGFSKWLPAVFRMDFFAAQASENGRPMEDLRWTRRYFAHWNALNQFSMHFNGLFYFAWRGFRSTVISLEQIILVKWGTTVLGKAPHVYQKQQPKACQKKT